MLRLAQRYSAGHEQVLTKQFANSGLFSANSATNASMFTRLMSFIARRCHRIQIPMLSRPGSRATFPPQSAHEETWEYRFRAQRRQRRDPSSGCGLNSAPQRVAGPFFFPWTPRASSFSAISTELSLLPLSATRISPSTPARSMPTRAFSMQLASVSPSFKQGITTVRLD